MATTDALPIPRKNTAYRLIFPGLFSDGTLLSTGTGMDSEVSKDQAAFSDCTNEATEIGTTGVYYLDLTSTEMDADCVVIKTTWTNSGALAQVLVLYPEETGDIRVNVTQMASGVIAAATFAANALDAVWATATRLLTAGTNIVLAKGTGVTGFNDLDAAGVRTAVGLATANLDTQLDALPTNAELATALGTADDATLAAIAALNNLSAAQVNAEVDTALADYDAPTHTELTSELATADDAMLAAIAALNNLSAAQVNAEVDTALADYDAPTNAEMVARTLVAANYATATAVDDVPTNAELATALSAADDATLAAIAALPVPLTAAGTRAAVGLASANLDTQLDAIPTNADLATSQAAADDATLAAIAALNNLSAAQVNAEVDTALADYDAPTNAEMVARTLPTASYATATALDAVDNFVDTEIAALTTAVDALPTNAELATALAAADDAVLAAVAALPVPLTAAGTRAAVGLASANLDTQLDALPTNAELATALGTADDAVLSALVALESHGDDEWSTATGFATVNPDNAAIALIKAVTDKLNSTLQASGLNYQFTLDALENAPAPALTQDQIDDIAEAAAEALGELGDPLLHLAPGDYPVGTAGYKIGLLSEDEVITISPLGRGTLLSIVRGDDYNSDRPIYWTNADWTGLDLTEAESVTFRIKFSTDFIFTKEATTVSDTQVQVELTSAETETFLASVLYDYDVEAVLEDGSVRTLVRGNVRVLADVR